MNKLGIFLFLGMTAITLTGCLDFASDKDSTPGFIDPGVPGASNSPPTISGSPPSEVAVGQNYSFTPTASDPDGDPLTFSVENKPGWASFNPSTGNLSGVAAVGSAGTYGNIRITVSDGNQSTALPQFAVDVLQSASGMVTLSWTPPTQNEDGSYLADLAGYGIYYGTQSGDYSNFIKIDNPGISSYVVENLTQDTYFFASTAFNTSDIESDYSNEATITVN